MDTLDLQCEFAAVAVSVVLFISTVGVSAVFYSWLRGATFLPDAWIPTSPMFIQSRKASLLSAISLSCAGLWGFLIAPYHGHVTSVKVSRDQEPPKWKLGVLSLWHKEAEPDGGLKQISYVYDFGRDVPEHYRFTLRFNRGKTYRTLPITHESARELQKYLRAHAPKAEWLSKPVL